MGFSILMTKAITTASVVSTTFAVIFALLVYFLQVEFDGLKATAEDLKTHKLTQTEQLAELKTTDALLSQRLTSLEEKISENGNKLDRILGYLAPK